MQSTSWFRCVIVGLMVIGARVAFGQSTRPAPESPPVEKADSGKGGRPADEKDAASGVGAEQDSVELVQTMLQEAVRRRGELKIQLEEQESECRTAKETHDRIVALWNEPVSRPALTQALEKMIVAAEKLGAEMNKKPPTPKDGLPVADFTDAYKEFTKLVDRRTRGVLDAIPFDQRIDLNLSDDAPEAPPWLKDIQTVNTLVVRLISKYPDNLSEVQKEAVANLASVGKSAKVDGLIEYFNKWATYGKKKIDGVVQKEEEDCKRIQKKLEGNKKEIDSLNATLLAQKSQNQFKIDSWLLYIFIGMLLGLPVMFMLLRLFDDATRSSLIENRTLIELIGLVYLLLAVLLLLTGEKLSKESGATLLGGIAGYVFARRGNTPATPTTPPKKPGE